jgi:hypothetical protein
MDEAAVVAAVEIGIEFMRGNPGERGQKDLPERSLGPGWLRSVPADLSLSLLHESVCVPDSCLPTEKNPGAMGRASRDWEMRVIVSANSWQSFRGDGGRLSFLGIRRRLLVGAVTLVVQERGQRLCGSFGIRLHCRLAGCAQGFG